MRNSTQSQATKNQNVSNKARLEFLKLGFDFGVCFGFRYSVFGFLITERLGAEI